MPREFTMMNIYINGDLVRPRRLEMTIHTLKILITILRVHFVALLISFRFPR